MKAFRALLRVSMTALPRSISPGRGGLALAVGVLALVPLTPGGAGISETVSGAALVGLGVGSADAAAAMLLLLVAMLVVPLLAGAVAVPAALTRTPARR